MSTSPTPIPTKRKRGGQPGNANALRHGFYSHSLRQAKTHGPDQINGGSLGSEINIRLYGCTQPHSAAVPRRILDLSNGVTDLD